MDERLKKFTRLIDEGSFTKAAATLHISQPALTTTIKNLERELGHALLIRDGKRLRITEAGKLVYTTSGNLADQVHNLKLKLAELTQEELSMTIGMIDSMAEAAFVHSNGFGQFGHKTQVSLVVDNSARLITGVVKGEIDIAFITRQLKALPSSLKAQSIGTEPLVIVTHPSRSSSVHQDLQAGCISNFISYNQASTTEQLLRRTMLERNIDVNTIFYSSSLEVMVQIVLSGKGVAALPYLMVKKLVSQKKLVPIVVRNSYVIDRDIYAVERKNRNIPAPLSSIRDHTSKILVQIQKQSQNLS